MQLRFVKKITDRGVLTLPTEIREALNVAEGDIVEFEVLRVIKKTAHPAQPSIHGSISQPVPPRPFVAPAPSLQPFPTEATQ
ncbi:MAG TPA: AbrB/MazE/SpoVT family DNA-binding domain-containing protein [Candidatus Thermoplasmatota archaeon]|nr:AbrB/MazE/SpoVT family DNA-binding domain-containing protein [Candidatus Thermoplasmatota archaeon]